MGARNTQGGLLYPRKTSPHPMYTHQSVCVWHVFLLVLVLCLARGGSSLTLPTGRSSDGAVSWTAQRLAHSAYSSTGESATEVSAMYPSLRFVRSLLARWFSGMLSLTDPLLVLLYAVVCGDAHSLSALFCRTHSHNGHSCFFTSHFSVLPPWLPGDPPRTPSSLVFLDSIPRLLQVLRLRLVTLRSRHRTHLRG
jgi:hypothetical protein